MNENLAHRLFPWVAYPFGVGVAIYLHLALLSWNMDIQVSTYIPIFLAAGLITVFEIYFPNLEKWRPRIEDVKNDVAYMLIVQTILPKALAFITALIVLRYVHSSNLAISDYWLHQLPDWAQAIAMILIADLLRYGFHVASHKNSFLWRFHAVHHSPKKLYWINTGRFHLVEKAVQFLFDALPFILLGVSENVLALYFVFYSVNGFFQHSNINLKFGVLNYLISTAELHRWHHSCVENESNSNYGNNTIIWDVLFGTRYLPANSSIEKIGLKNQDYPSSFVEQLRTPFVRGIDKKVLPLPGFKELIVNGLIKLQMGITKYTIWKPVVNAARNPVRAQNNFLRDVISKNANTGFGIAHRFNEIDSYKKFSRHVPTQTYESLKPYFEKQAFLKDRGISVDPPVMYAVTSGTTGASKYIPVLEETLKQNKKHQKLFTYIQYRDNPGTFSGKMLGIVSPAVEGYTRAGTAYGSVSGVLYKNMPLIMKSKYVLPFEVFSIEDYELKYKLILRIALVHKDITYLVSANPSTFLMLHSLMNKYFDELVDDIERGLFREHDRLSEGLQKSIRSKLKPNPQRAKELRVRYAQNREITFATIWPALQTVVTWTGGSCGIALAGVKQKLPAATKVVELGYMATEVRGTITVDVDNNLGMPTIQDNFFEFVERDNWENDKKEFLTIEQLADTKEYYIFITTSSGLYRYFINDIIRVTGRIEKTPAFQFVQKGKGVTNITGEKLYEYQVLEAVKRIEQDFNFTSIFFIMLADKTHSNYELFIEIEDAFEHPLETVRTRIESCLCELNIEYASKCASGRLKPMALKLIKYGTRERFKRQCLEDGQKESQFKVVTLQYKDEVKFSFDDYVSACS